MRFHRSRRSSRRDLLVKDQFRPVRLDHFKKTLDAVFWAQSGVTLDAVFLFTRFRLTSILAASGPLHNARPEGTEGS